MINSKIIGQQFFITCSDCGVTKQYEMSVHINGLKNRFEQKHKACRKVEKSKLRKHIEEINK